MRVDKRSVKPGDTFGDLEVLERVGSTQKGAATFRCVCHACGSTVIKEGYRLRDNNAKDCGCRRKLASRDISSETHGNILVLRRMPANYPSGDSRYSVKCLICGKEREMPKNQILTNPASCGCAHYTAERMADLSKSGVKAAIVDGVNINSVFKPAAAKNSQTGVRGVFPERRKGILTGQYCAAVMVHGERRIKSGFLTIDSAKKWRGETQQELLKKYNVKEHKK